ncbi:hypothetical protein [Flavobacterium kingsejongi]|uniref:Uncharacterized protein n=1 Tax=Flavobacterium kingsejongi TaxID=1678728 RepID=A0A2S1LQ28_9FLAO|nr:hypothetical protein [Flavobacterium kingsejongi]AWG25829.1 hypothetical protein FK004_11655 [Flavobacterium kingsejongi]
MATSNSVQNTMDSLVSKWQNAYILKEVKMVCITYTPKEESMMEAFLDYILALDNQIENFVWVFESVFENEESFALDIANEMQELVQDWNTMNKPAEYDASEINWKPVFEHTDFKNPMQLLVHNLNSFAKNLFPNRDIEVCYVFKNFDISKSEAYQWIKLSLEFPFEKNITWTVVQSTENLVYQKAIDSFPKEVKEIKSDINVNAVVEQLVAQADPTKPENVYRSELVKLMHAVEDRNKDKVSIQTKKCLDIVIRELKNDPNWISQVVTVYVILYNDQIGYKNYNEAIYFADKAVEASEIAQKTTDVSIGNRLAGQTHIGRGSIYVLKNDWKKANEDYIKAKEAYKQCDDYLMQIEACRLCGWSGNKFDKEINVLPFYIEGFNLHSKLTSELLSNSTFPLLLKEVIYNINFENQVSKQKLDEVLIPLFGQHYKFEIDQYGTVK